MYRLSNLMGTPYGTSPGINIPVLSLILFFLFTISPFRADAYDVELNGVYYGIFGTSFAYVTHRGLEGDAGSYKGDVVIPEQISYRGRTYKVLTIGDNAFAGSEELTSVRFPSTVKALSACAFIGCTALRQVTIPTSISAFSSCVFTGCTSLQKITLPRYTEIVDTLTFYCCKALTSMILPHRINKVCQGAFEHCLSMKHLYLYASTPPEAEPGAFTPGDQKRCTLHVPKYTLQKYKEAPVWKDFYRIVALTDNEYTSQNYQRGDINDDGKVDAEDLALLRRVIVSLPDDAAVHWAADINADGKVNGADYVALAKIIKN